MEIKFGYDKLSYTRYGRENIIRTFTYLKQAVLLYKLAVCLNLPVHYHWLLLYYLQSDVFSAYQRTLQAILLSSGAPG